MVWAKVRTARMAGLLTNVGEVRDRVSAAGWEDCLVIECADFVVDRLRSAMRDTRPQHPRQRSYATRPDKRPGEQAIGPACERMDRRPTKLGVDGCGQSKSLWLINTDEAFPQSHPSSIPTWAKTTASIHETPVPEGIDIGTDVHSFLNAMSS